MTVDLKKFYTDYSDEINAKRLNSEFAVRKYAHACQYESVLNQVKPGQRVLDAGCGEGALSVMLAKKGAIVTGTDISVPNIEAAKRYAENEGVQINFSLADSENLPFADNEFDIVVCSHVLEHVPDFDKGFLELMRVTKSQAVIAIPTVLNLCSFVQVGGGQYFLKGVRSFISIFIGFVLTLWAAILQKEGVDEGYVGKKGVIHIFRFPGVMRKKIKKYNFTLVHQEASSLCLPFFEILLPFSRFLDKFRASLIFRDLGYGTTYVVKK